MRLSLISGLILFFAGYGFSLTRPVPVSEKFEWEGCPESIQNCINQLSWIDGRYDSDLGAGFIFAGGIVELNKQLKTLSQTDKCTLILKLLPLDTDMETSVKNSLPENHEHIWSISVINRNQLDNLPPLLHDAEHDDNEWRVTVRVPANNINLLDQIIVPAVFHAKLEGPLLDFVVQHNDGEANGAPNNNDE